MATKPAAAPGANPASGPPNKPVQKPVQQTKRKEKPPCRHLCSLVPVDVPVPGQTQAVLHPRKDVFVLKVAKVGPNGDRRCKMELELVTPKFPEKPNPYRVDTRETQCEPECPSCCCNRVRKRINKN